MLAILSNPPPGSRNTVGSEHWWADIGEYRIICRFDATTVLVSRIGKRNDDEVYR